MTALLTLLATVMVAFPRPGEKLPAIDRCYVIGSVTPGETFVTVQDCDVDVSPEGGWVTMVDVTPGTNTIQVGDTNITFVVAEKKPSSGGAIAVPAKTYEKLAYAADMPRPAPATNAAPETITVVLDAGHGDHDTGALTPYGWPEKEANLAIVKLMQAELIARGYHVVLTRADDTFVKLYDRPKVAHENQAAAFISIHHNAPPFDRDPRETRYTAVYAWNKLGEELAAPINRRMAAAFGETLKNNGVMHGNLAVTRNPEIPSCLVEVDFITTPEGAADSWNRARQRRVAKAIVDGFVDWTKGIKQ